MGARENAGEQGRLVALLPFASCVSRHIGDVDELPILVQGGDCAVSAG